jgi:hypothetical protein
MGVKALPGQGLKEAGERLTAELAETKVDLGRRSEPLVVGILQHLPHEGRKVMLEDVLGRIAAATRPRWRQLVEDPLRAGRRHWPGT